MNITVDQFIKELSSKSPVPGGGGASALIGAIGVSLCSMVANLTIGKEKYEEYEADLEHILAQTQDACGKLLECIAKDAEAFLPLSSAYSLPKEVENRDQILEQALLNACSTPLEILREIEKVIVLIEELSIKGSKLAMSDVALAASACKSGMEGACMTVYINTKSMKNKETANRINLEASNLLSDGVYRCNIVYRLIAEDLMS
jgi:formiminotetrahydrofolate cyclodeaminase